MSSSYGHHHCICSSIPSFPELLSQRACHCRPWCRWGFDTLKVYSILTLGLVLFDVWVLSIQEQYSFYKRSGLDSTVPLLFLVILFIEILRLAYDLSVPMQILSAWGNGVARPYVWRPLKQPNIHGDQKLQASVFVYGDFHLTIIFLILTNHKI